MASGVDPSSMRAAVEAACEQFKDPATQAQAEQVLLQFRQSPRPLAACQHILEHSPLVDARCHAAITLKYAAVQEWATMSPEEQAHLRTYLLQYILHHSGERALSVVRSVLVGALAVVLKRGWLDMAPDARRAFFQELVAGASAVGTPAAQRTALEALEAVVCEFSLGTASALGLAWDFHQRCRSELEAEFLPTLFRHALAEAQAAASSGGALEGSDEGACAAALSLLVAVLGWDFRHTGGKDALLAAAAARSRGWGAEGTQVEPGQGWSDTLLAPSTTGWLLELLAALQQQGASSSSSSPLAQQARTALVALCSLAGDVFPRPPPGEAAAPATLAHVQRMLHGVLPWVAAPHAALRAALAGEEGQLVDACKALAVLCANHRAHALDAAATALAAAAPGAPPLFEALQALTCALLMAGGVSASAAPEAWVFDCAELLLEAWAALLVPRYSGGGVVAPPAGAVAGARACFVVLVDVALRDATQGAHEEAEDDEAAASSLAHAEEWLARAASLGRADPAASFPHLAGLLAAQCAALAAAADARADTSEPLERLVWLLAMASHCLADSGDGETALPPEPVAAAAACPAGADAVVGLSHALAEVAALALQGGGAAAVCSPRLMEAAVRALARWADTYLFPEEELPQALGAAFGPQGSGPALLEASVRLASACLVGYPGERELHTQVCTTLLPVLARRPALSARLLQSAPWQQLAGAFASRDPQLAQQLQQKLHRSLARAMCVAAAGHPSPEAAAQYVTQLMSGVAAEVSAAAAAAAPGGAHASRDGVLGRADHALRLSCALESLRGAAQGTLPATQPALWALWASLLQPLLVVHGAVRAQPQLVALVLKLAADIVEAQVPWLQRAELTLLLQWCLALLQQYADANLSEVSLQTAAALRAERAAEQCRDLRAVLKLLTHITSRDILTEGGDCLGGGGGGGAHEPPADVAQVVLLGLRIVLPLMRSELLGFPKLARLHFGLLVYLMEAYPQQVASVAPEHFAALMRSLDAGLGATDSVVVQCCLEGLAGLARFQWAAQQAGQPGLSVHTSGGVSVVAHFQRALLQRLLLEDTAQDQVELAADALLPLLLAEPATFQQLGESLVAAHAGEPRTAAAIRAALQQLAPPPPEACSGEAGQPALSRQAARQFRASVCRMVADVRGLIRVK